MLAPDFSSTIWNHALHGNTEEVCKLLDQGYSTNQGDEHGQAPLYLAAKGGHLHTTELLLTRGALVDQLKDNGSTALSVAAFQGHDSILRLLLERGAEVDHVNDEGNTPLMFAVQQGHLHIVELLQYLGADILHANADGATPLHFAAHHGHLDVVEWLLAQGAEVDQTISAEDSTPLQLAVEQSHLDIVRLLLKHTDPSNIVNLGSILLTFAAQAGHLEIVRHLLDCGADINYRGYLGETALFIAAFEGDIRIVELLLERNALVYLVEAGAGSSPLFVAAQEGHLQIVEELIDQGGADVNQYRESDEWTPLMIAIDEEHDAVAERLLRHGANYNLRSIDGMTPLGMAATAGSDSIVQMLLEYGSDVEAKIGVHAETALELARQADHASVVDLLKSAEGAFTDACAGRVERFRDAIVSGKFPAPIMQWGPYIPPPAWNQLLSWVSASLADSRACYAALFHSTDGDVVDSKLTLRAVTHDGFLHIRRVLISYLVFPKESTRRLLREVAAYGLSSQE
jgi:ankyrin repeat protein